MKDLNSAKVNLWSESLDSTVSSFFSVMMDVFHVLLIVRFLTQEEVGIFFFSYGFLYLFSQVTRGYSVAIRKRATERNSNRSIYLWNGLTVIIPTLLIVFILYAISTPFINTYSYINLSYSVVISTFLATIGFSILELSRYYLAGCNKPGLAERVRAIMGKITMITGTIIGLWLFPTVETALIIVFITYTITGIYILSLSPNEFKYPKKEVIIEILSFSKWSLPTAILNDFYHRWDTILLGFMVGYLALGYYDSSLRIAFLATVLGVGISKTSNVKISGLFEMDKNIMKISKQTIIASTFLVMPMLLIIYFNSEFILSNLYGSEYIAAKWYLIGITVIQIFQCYRMQFESIFNSIDNPKITTKISGISVIFNVLTAPLFVILFGGMGVIYSTLLSEIIRILAYEYKFKNNFNSYILPFGVLTQIIIVIILFSIIQLTDIIISLTNIELLILSTVISIIGFYSLQYLLSSETRQIVQDYRNEN